MDAPLAQCTREEQRAVVRFLWSEGSSGTKIHQRLLAQYGDNALSKTTVYEWIEKFKTGRTSVKHAEGAGRPSTSTSKEKIEQAQQMILANRRITIDEVAQSLQISFGSAQEIIHEILGYNKVSARWVPRQLTEEHKRRRMEICQTLLNRYNNEGEAFLSRIVTGDESWVHHYSPETNLFAPLKDALRGRKFSSDESVQKAVHQWLCDQPKTFFSDGIYKLVDRWNKCIEMGGDYVEK